MKNYRVRVNYVSPLLMKSTRGVNPMDPLVKEAKAINAKTAKKRTDEDLIRLLEIDFELGAYYDPEIGMYIPAEMMEASIREGCKVHRNGEKSKIAIFVQEEKIPLIYNGPRTLKELWESTEFKDTRIVTVNGKSKVTRCRPRFNRWGLEFTVTLDESILNPEEFFTAVDLAGKQKGIGDYRPRYGRYAAKIEEIA